MSEATENHTITNIGAGITKAVMNSNPITGFVQTIYDEYASRQWQQRREKWEEVLEEKLQNLQNDVDLLKINSIPNFAQILANATQGAMSDIEEDKVGLYANTVINSIKNENIDNTKTHIFLNMLKDFTKIHIELLKYFSQVEAIEKKGREDVCFISGIKNNENWYKNVYHYNKLLFSDKAIYELVYNELVSLNLLKNDGQYLTDNVVNEFPKKQTTLLADEFLQFIEEQEKNNG